jgi:hypothetical protein
MLYTAVYRSGGVWEAAIAALRLAHHATVAGSANRAAVAMPARNQRKCDEAKPIRWQMPLRMPRW